MHPIARALAKVSGNTLLSRILGLARDILLARLFGANATTDAFFAAFRIPNLARRLFAEGTLALALVPVLDDYRQRSDPRALKRLIDHLSGSLAALLMLVTALGILAAPLLILVFAPGFLNDPAQHAQATTMLRLMLPYVGFIGLTALAGAILNTHERFGVPAFTPALLNLTLIACALWLAPQLGQPVIALAWGVLLAGAVQLGFQLPFLHRLGLLPRPRLNLPGSAAHPGVRRVSALLGPAALAASAGQISLLLNTLLASLLATGSITWLYYADRLMEFPQGLLGAALGTVILPRLTRAYRGGARSDFRATLDWSLRWTLLLGLPASLGLAVLAEPLLATLLYSPAFGAHDIRMAGQALMAYSPGIVAVMAVKALTPAFFARQQAGASARSALHAVAAGLVLSLLLMVPLRHAGLALGTVGAALVNAALLLRILHRDGWLRPQPGWLALTARALLATLVMGFAVWLARGELAWWLHVQSGERILRLGLLVGVGAMLYVAALLALGLRPRDLRAPPAQQCSRRKTTTI